jgi:hypothetical protein
VNYAGWAKRISDAAGERSAPVPRSPAGGLRIGAVNDVHEQEADRVADEVMTEGATKRHWSVSALAGGTSLQRTCSCGGSGGADGECEECKNKKEEGLVQRKETSARTPAFAPSLVHEVLNSPGQPLSKSARQFFEPRFGHDLGHVTIHTGARASESAEAVHAHAYTVGRSIVFGSNRYEPDTSAGRRLLAHEISHVFQQTSRSSRGTDSSVPNLQRQTDATDLDREYASAVEIGDWPKAAEKLNAFNRNDIDARLAKLSSDEILQLHAGAVANPAVGPDSQVAQMTRKGRPLATVQPAASVVSDLDKEYAAAVASANWQDAAEKLNGFSAADIKSRLGQLSADQIDNVHKGAVNNRRVGPDSQVAKLTTRSVSVGTTAGASDTGVPMDQREPLEPGQDYMADPAYVDNVVHATYNLLTNLFEMQHADGTSFDIDADRIRKAARSGQKAPGGAIAGGLFFRSTKDRKIYPVFFTAGTIPNIVACWDEVEKATPEALNQTRDALIDVAVAAHGVAHASIKSSQQAAKTESATGGPRLKPSQAARRAFAKLEPEYAEKLGVGPGGVVHHARELQLLDKYPGAFTEDELNAFGNMRGIPKKFNDTMHLSGFRTFWNEAYEFIDNVVKERKLAPGTNEYNQFVRDVVDRYYRRIDDAFGHLFTEYGKVLK